MKNDDDHDYGDKNPAMIKKKTFRDCFSSSVQVIPFFIVGFEIKIEFKFKIEVEIKKLKNLQGLFLFIRASYPTCCYNLQAVNTHLI